MVSIIKRHGLLKKMIHVLDEHTGPSSKKIAYTTLIVSSSELLSLSLKKFKVKQLFFTLIYLKTKPHIYILVRLCYFKNLFCVLFQVPVLCFISSTCSVFYFKYLFFVLQVPVLCFISSTLFQVSVLCYFKYLFCILFQVPVLCFSISSSVESLRTSLLRLTSPDSWTEN